MHLSVRPVHPSLPVSSYRFPLPTFRLLHRLFVLVALFTLGWPPTHTNATVVIPVADTELAQQASDIVIGRITKMKSAWDKNHQQIFTKITLSVDEVLKGNISKRRLTVTQMGGVVGDVQSWVDGNAEFTVGEKVLLFLSRTQNNSLRVLHLYQGKFSIFTDTDSSLEMAYREAHPEGVHVLRGHHAHSQRSAVAASEMATTDADNGFLPLADLKKRIQHTLSHPDSPLPSPTPYSSSPSSRVPPTSVRQEAPFTLLGSPAARWFEPDSGAAVPMRVNSTNSPTGATSAVQSALNVWGSVSGSSFRFQNVGSTTEVGFRGDGTNAISFGDPLNQIDPPAGCSGVLAIGGYFRSGSITTTINGQTYYKIVEGDLVFANGWNGCGFYESPANIAEVTTHELGHVIGMGHSADSDATMFAYAHFDGRGAAIRADDIAGLRSIYPSPCTYTVSASTISVGADAARRSFTVTPSVATCTWTTTNVPSWITVTAGASGTGTGTVTLSIAANTTTTARSATLTVAGKSVTVNQAAASTGTSCTYSVSATNIPVGSGAATRSLTVTPSVSTCTWTTTNVPSWITVTAGASGTGTGTVTLSIAANTSTTARSATLTIAGQSVSVSQAAASTGASCTYSVSATNISVGASAARRSFTVTPSASTCTWTTTNVPVWITVTAGASGTGTGTVTLSIATNTWTTTRSATITVAGKSVNVTQSNP